MNEHRVLQDRLIADAAALRGVAESLRFRPAGNVEVQAAVGVADLAAHYRRFCADIALTGVD